MVWRDFDSTSSQDPQFIVNKDKYQAEQDVKFIEAAKFLTAFWKEVELSLQVLGSNVLHVL